MTANLFSDETTLLQQVAQGNERAFAQLVDNYAPRLFAYMVKLTFDRDLAEELVQDCFLKIWLARENLADIKNIKSYLFTISHNQAVNEVKKIIRQKANRKEWESYQSQGEMEAADNKEWQYNLIDEAVAALPPRQQEVWIMRRRQNMKTGEIAEQLGLTSSSVKKYLQLATASIAEYVKERMPLLLLLVSGCQFYS